MRFELSVIFYYFIVVAAYTQELPPGAPKSVDELMIEIKGPSQGITYTNEQAGVYYTETHAEHRSRLQGWRITGKEMLEDYAIRINSVPLQREEAERVQVLPHQFKRFYPNGMQETITLLDSLNALVVELDSASSTEMTAYPMFSGSHRQEDYVIAFDKNIMLISHKDHMERTKKQNYPAVVAISWIKENLWSGGFYDTATIGNNFAPCFINTVNPISKHVLVITIGDSANDAVRQMKFVSKNYESLIAVRRDRMEMLLSQPSLNNSNPHLDKPLLWATLSMSALTLSQLPEGIFAGTSWREYFQKKDAVNLLPGALAVTGDIDNAKNILKSFAELQEINVKSTEYGGIPKVSSSSVSKNVDVTPWYTFIAAEYVKQSNERGILREVFPIIKRAIEGKLKYHVDKSLLLKPNDSVQTLQSQWIWNYQLDAGVQIASMAGDAASAKKWASAQQKLLQKLKKK